MPGSLPEPLRPIALSKEGDDRLVIQWNDGHRSIYGWKHLRDNCPCASCREERGKPPDPFRLVKPAELLPLRPTAVAPVGHYAYRVSWSPDGSELLMNRTNRRQNVMELTACSPATGKCRVVVREEWPTGWVMNSPPMQFLEDGRRFLHHDTAQYDYAVVDAYAGGTPAAHLFSREAFLALRERLTPSGIAAVNVAVDSLDGPVVRAIGATLGHVFEHVIAVRADAPDAPVNSVIFFASAEAFTMPAEWNPEPADPRTAAILASLSSQLLPLNELSGLLLTDDFNPMDTMTASTERKLREQARAALPDAILEP